MTRDPASSMRISIFVSVSLDLKSHGVMGRGPADVCIVVHTDLLVGAEACPAFAPEGGALSLAIPQTDIHDKGQLPPH